jgi:hypothetical protein
MQVIRRIFLESGYIGQGNPAIARHPVTPQQCQEKIDRLEVRYGNEEFERICGGKYMAPLYDPAVEKAKDAKACIDQFEFPDIPCVYPVVWVRAREAAEICWAMGKRLCDAHEWEGACAGALEPPDYRFDLAKNLPPNKAIERMREIHNHTYGVKKVWAYGSHYQKGICACSSQKTSGCDGGDGRNAGQIPSLRAPSPIVIALCGSTTNMEMRPST